MKRRLTPGPGEPKESIEHWSDEELMIVYAQGADSSEEAFRLLYRRYSDRVYGFLAGKLRDRSLTDDAHQAAFLKLHLNRKRYDASFPFAPWLFTVCRSAMLDTLRMKQRRDRHEEINPIAVETAVAEPPDGKVPVPGLQVLPAAQRQAIEMRYLEDLSFDEIATRLETSSANSRKLISRALQKLRGLLSGGDHE